MRAGALLLLALVLAAPVASADHVYSHRAMVVGRVVDADGEPAPGLALQVETHGFDVAGPCHGFDDSTNATGDFRICRHAHVVPPNANVTLRLGNLSWDVALDPLLRQGSIAIQLPHARDARDVTGDRAFHRTLLVAGRVFAHARSVVEAIPVNATAMEGNVTVALVAGDATLAQANASLDENGEFVVALPAQALPADAKVRVDTARGATTFAANATMRRVDAGILLEPPSGPDLAQAPGNRTPSPAWGAFAALALSAAARWRRR